MPRSLALATLLLGPVACGDDDGGCIPGTEGCSCLGPERACATGLYCADGRCRPLVDEEATASDAGAASETATKDAVSSGNGGSATGTTATTGK
jgi:hypothetical protein